MEETTAQLTKIRVEGEAGAGMVRVVANAQLQVVECHIDAELVKEGDKEVIEQLVVTAANQALDKARKAAADEYAKITDGLDVSGLRELLPEMRMKDGI